MTCNRPSGIECIGNLPWGTHLCEFYSTHEELRGTLIPYFAAGLQQDEFCLWVTSDPSGAEGAKIGLRKTAPYMERYLDSGQMEIWDYRDWYLHGGYFDADRVFGQWVDKQRRSVDSGYKGLRLSGDTAWLDKRTWPDFMMYESEVNRVFPQHRIIGLCTYPLEGCQADAMLEVVRNHRFALTRIAGKWETIEPVRIETSVSQRLQQLSADVLEQQDETLRWIATQLHEVTAQNLAAIGIYLSGLPRRRSCRSAVKFILAKCRTLCEQSLQQILNLSQSLHPLTLDELGLAACLRQDIEEFMRQSGIHVEFQTGAEIERLPADTETHLFRIAQEGLSNVRRHSGSLHAIVRLRREADQVILQIEDSGRGMSATTIADVLNGTHTGGFGLLEMQERLRKIGGHLEIRSDNQGTMLTARIRLS